MLRLFFMIFVLGLFNLNCSHLLRSGGSIDSPNIQWDTNIYHVEIGSVVNGGSRLKVSNELIFMMEEGSNTVLVSIYVNDLTDIELESLDRYRGTLSGNALINVGGLLVGDEVDICFEIEEDENKLPECYTGVVQNGVPSLAISAEE